VTLSLGQQKSSLFLGMCFAQTIVCFPPVESKKLAAPVLQRNELGLWCFAHSRGFPFLSPNLTTPILHGVRRGDGQGKDELSRASRLLDFDIGVHFDAGSLGLSSSSMGSLAYGIDSKHDYD
jgi:hypothetical protein